jgi:uncharacterized protein
VLHSIKFNNFCSFSDEAEIDLTINEKVPESDWFGFSSNNNSRVSKVLAFIGPNASGKTSALKAIAFLQWLLTDSFQQMKGENDTIPLDQFEFTKEDKSPTYIQIQYDCKGVDYRYEIKLIPERILFEAIYKKEDSRFNYLVKREWIEDEKRYFVKQQDGFGLEIKVAQNILRQNVSLIAAGEALNNSLLKELVEFWREMATNVNRKGKTWVTLAVTDSSLSNAASSYKKEEQRFNLAKKILKNMDLGLSDIELEPIKVQKESSQELKDVILPIGIHKIQDSTFQLALNLESSGTKNLFVLLNKLLPVLEKGSLAVIDELEADLHPHMIPVILRLFAQKNTNSKNAQLLFTCHSIEVLKLLEKEQVVLVEKNKEGRSSLFRLDDIKSIRRNENLYAKYNAGAYGAIPNL